MSRTKARNSNRVFAFQNLELTEAESKIKTLHAAITEITDRIASAGDEITNENAELTAAVTALTDARQTSDAMSEELAELNRRAGEARNERAEIEIRQAEAVTQLKNTAENCQQELNISLAELVETIELDEDFVLDNCPPRC